MDNSARSAAVNTLFSSESSRRRFTKARPNLYLAIRRSVFAHVRTARFICRPFVTSVDMNGTPCIQTSMRRCRGFHRSVVHFTPQLRSIRSVR
jgi:hypothetical protein